MESTACDVQHRVQHEFGLDVNGVRLPSPTSIKDQMPYTSECLRSIAAQLGREHAQEMVRNGAALRKAYDAGDAATVWRICASGQAIAAATENGYQFGVPTAQRTAMLKQHRAKRYGAN